MWRTADAGLSNRLERQLSLLLSVVPLLILAALLVHAGPGLFAQYQAAHP